MVPHPRASLGAGALRPLNAPALIWVQADPSGSPQAVRRRGWPRARAVARVQDRWRIDDEWWREQPISRMYYSVLLEDGTVLTIYRDLVAAVWCEQRS